MNLRILLVFIAMLLGKSAGAIPWDVAPLGHPDGTVDAADAVVTLRMALGFVPKDLNADIAPLGSPDHEIRTGDALLILRFGLGLMDIPSERIGAQRFVEVGSDFIAVYDFATSLAEETGTFREALPQLIHDKQTARCDDGGKIVFSADAQDDYSVFTIDYKDCREDGALGTGQIIYRFDGNAAEGNLSFSSLVLLQKYKIVEGDEAMVIDGSITVPSFLSQPPESPISPLVVDLTLEDNVRKLSIHSLVLPNPFAQREQHAPWEGDFDYSDYGSFRISLDKALVFDSEDAEYPSSGGPIHVRGPLGEYGTIIPEGTAVRLELAPGGNATTIYGSLDWTRFDDYVLPDDGGLPPVADAGDIDSYSVTDQWKFRDMEGVIRLDGRGSHDPEQALLHFEWTVLAAPNHSDAYLSDPNSPAPLFHPDRLGQYQLRLRVSDGRQWSLPQDFLLSIGNVDWEFSADFRLLPETPALEGQSHSAITRFPVNTVPGRGPGYISLPIKLTYHWRIASAPEGSSAVIENPQAKNTSFIPDLPGQYTVALVVNGGLRDQEEMRGIYVDAYEATIVPRVSWEWLFNQRTTLVSTPLRLKIQTWVSVGPAVDTYRWKITRHPVGHPGILTTPTEATTEFIASAPGAYDVELTVANALETSKPLRRRFFAMHAPVFESTVVSGLDREVPGGGPIDALAIGDVNLDNLDDVILTINLDWDFLVYPQESGGRFGAPIRQRTVQVPRAKPVFIADIVKEEVGNEVLFVTRNGGLDSEDPRERVEIYNAAVDSRLVFAHSIEQKWMLGTAENIDAPIQIGDLNGDGLPDLGWSIFTRDQEFSGVQVSYQRPGGGFSPPIPVAGLGDREIIAKEFRIADINNDGRDDVVLLNLRFMDGRRVTNARDRERIRPRVFVQRLDGTIGPVADFDIDIERYSPSSGTRFGDLDGDGDQDLLSVANQNIVMWHQTTPGVFRDPVVIVMDLGNDSDPAVLKVRDMNGDGLQDIVALMRIGGVIVLFQTGPGEFEQAQDFTDTPFIGNAVTFRDIAIGDLDADGDPDIVVRSGKTVIVLKNNSIP